jgi:hypothetical protein
LPQSVALFPIHRAIKQGNQFPLTSDMYRYPVFSVTLHTSLIQPTLFNISTWK